MFYKILLILFITILAYPGKSIAQEAGYRIEIIVLSHLKHDAQPLNVTSLQDFSESLDFLTVMDEAEEAAEKSNSGRNDSAEATEPADSLSTESEELAAEPDPWAQVTQIEEMGEVMQVAWRRLRLSAPFRPQQYLSWVQSADEPFPLLRIHNPEIVLINDPYAEQHFEQSGGVSASSPNKVQATVFSDQGGALPGDPLEESEIPDPILFYQIDGTVMLKRTRFLHLDLDLEMREPVFDEGAVAQALLASDETVNSSVEMPRPDAFLVHSLKQSRQVKSDRLEYFDGPVLSVLAYISAAEIEEVIMDDAEQTIQPEGDPEP